jgi:hypothetical protein
MGFMNARRLTSATLAALCAVAVALLVSSAPALAVRGHVFEKPVGTPGVGAGQLLNPQGVAVNESSSDVYVADKANNRIDEFTATGAFVRAWGYDVVSSGADNTGANAVQKVTIKASGGKFSLTVRTAEGAGTLTSGSKTISGVSNGLGAFHVGDAITGTGIPSFTTITAVEAGTGTLTISANATASGIAALTASENTGATGTGNLTELTSTVSGVVMRSGEFAAGERISGAGIPAGTTITAVGSGTLTLSNPVEAGKSGTGVVLTATDIPYNASQSELESALKALPGTGSGSLTIARVEKSSTEFEDTITFSGGPFAHNYVEKMTLTTGNLEGAKFGTGVTTSATGGGFEVCQAGASPADTCKAGIAGSLGQPSLPTAIAVDNSQEPPDPSADDVYVTSGNRVEKFTAAGAFENQLTGTPNRSFPSSLDGVAVNRSGEVWTDYEPSSGENYVARFGNGEPNAFVSEVNLAQVAGAMNGSFEQGFAVDGENNLYLKGNISDVTSKLSKRVEKRSSSGTLLIAEVGEEPAGWPAVEYPSEDVYVGQTTRVARFTSTGSLVERFGEGDLTSTSGIAVNSTSGTVYAADSLANTIDVFPLELPGKPTIESISVSHVASGSATFEAQIDPRGAAGGYRFEYGPCSSLAVASCAASSFPTPTPKPDASIGSGWEVYGASARPQSLEPNTTYHFRVAAHNEHGEAISSDEVVFTTQRLGGELQLLDGRQWEMVSPPNKHGGRLLAPGGKEPEGVYEAAAGGGAMTYVSLGATEEGAQGSGAFVQVLSARAAAGWSSHDIATPNDEGTGQSERLPEYRFFSQDLGLAVLAPYGPFTPLARCSASGACTSEVFPPVSERTVYERHNLSCESEPATCYTPLVTSAEGYADVQPPGTKFGGEETYSPGAVEPIGATPDGSHVVLSSTVALTEEAFETGSAPSTANPALYEWSADKPPSERLQLVSVLPQAEGGKGVSNVDLGVLQSGSIIRNAISRSDGSRVFWSEHSASSHLYMRDLARLKPETIQLGTGKAMFQAASANGTRAFFLEGSGLYVCEIIEEAGQLGCSLTDLTAGAGQPGKVSFASEDGSYVYFFDTGVLTNKESSEHETAVAGAPNLYVRHYDSETKSWEASRLIAVLSLNDQYEWAGFGPKTNLSQTMIRVSPNGRYLAFMSDRPLTGYDNRDSNPEAHEARDEEVYLYDSHSRSVTCVSCNPTGARPAGEQASYEQLLNNKLKNGAWFSAAVPAWNAIPAGQGVYQPRYLTDEGRVFFDSTEALVPQDKNGAMDVYEYEPPGVPKGGEHPCTTSSPTYSGERSGGCVQLVSSGTSGRESAFLDASESGGDVFFLTAAKLAGQDYDTAYDVYDAHECTAQSPCFSASAAASLPCTEAESCREAPAQQPSVFGPPPSALFTGEGNLAPPASKPAANTKASTRAHKLANALKACRKQKKRKRRAACERQARKRYGAKSARKASASRRGRR